MPSPVERELVGEATVEIDRGAVPPVVAVTGHLGREGGALLAAMLAHVQRQSGPQIVLDLWQVSYADRFGLAPVLDAGTVIGDASPVVDRELCALVGGRALMARRLRGLRHRRPAVVVL